MASTPSPDTPQIALIDTSRAVRENDAQAFLVMPPKNWSCVTVVDKVKHLINSADQPDIVILIYKQVFSGDSVKGNWKKEMKCGRYDQWRHSHYSPFFYVRSSKRRVKARCDITVAVKTRSIPKRSNTGKLTVRAFQMGVFLLGYVYQIKQYSLTENLKMALCVQDIRMLKAVSFRKMNRKKYEKLVSKEIHSWIYK